jgi:hypothetical protein
MNERERIKAAMARIEAWQANPTLAPAQAVRLTGLSRMRVWYLIDSGVFGLTRDREIPLNTIRKWYDGRLSKIVEARKKLMKSM